MSTVISDLSSLLGPSQRVYARGEPDFFKELIELKESDIDAFVRQTESNLRFLQEKLSRVPQGVADAVLIDPTVMHGNPVFRGTRIPLYQIVEELAEGYPSLKPEKIRRGLDFVATLLRIYDEEVSD